MGPRKEKPYCNPILIRLISWTSWPFSPNAMPPYWPCELVNAMQKNDALTSEHQLVHVNQEVPVEQIIIFIGSVTHGPSSIVWRHVTIGLKCIGMVSSIRVQLVLAIIPGKTSFFNVQAMKSNKWTWILKGTIPEFMWVKEVGLSVWLMTTAEFEKFEYSRVIEIEQGSYYRKWNLLGVKEPLKFLRTLKVLINSFC